MPLGIYISVPFCRTKCSYCNFASDVFSVAAHDRYVERVCADMARAQQRAHELGCRIEGRVDSIYLGGGTPTVLAPEQLQRVFTAVRTNFDAAPDAEITVECAPGTLSDVMLDTLLRVGVNRVSLGVQSFVDQESRAVGRLHTKASTLADIERLRRAGIDNLNVDLIAGLPHQTAASWCTSVDEAIASGAPHVSVYMLEVDEDSRLGRELIAGGTRYHAHFVPNEDATADFYQEACERLEAAGIHQYEISNFAQSGRESVHNLKYWTRQPYLGFGVDAHSMLPAPDVEVLRLAEPDSLDDFVAGKPGEVTRVNQAAALEESFFLGLRLNRGVDLGVLRARFGAAAMTEQEAAITDLTALGLLLRDGERVQLSARGRLLSNEVFQRFLTAADPK